MTGFSTVRREGVELAGSATFTINADLRVGTLEETITVTGESPIVDVQTARRDLRVAKLVRVGGMRANVGLDIFNIINAAPGLSYNENFIANGPWLTPPTVMTARFAKLSAQIDF